jgi:quinolinate synthase
VAVRALETINEYYQLSREELADRIRLVKTEKNALILVHNYQRLEIQKLGDFVGDSLQLAKEAAKTGNPIIVLCGVHFMAESAKILNPGKRVFLPDRNAGCPMANMITAEALREFRSRYPGALVVCYVNSTAEVKAESDVCCTSSNAVNVVRSLGKKQILFVPDRNLADFVRRKTGADIIPWDGFCVVHDRMSRENVEQARSAHPNAVLMVHPECPPQVIECADAVESTAGMVRAAKESGAGEFIVGTEMGLTEQLRESNPGKKFYPLSDEAVCMNMKLTDLGKLAWCLDHEQFEISVPEPVRAKAYQALQRMVNL